MLAIVVTPSVCEVYVQVPFTHPDTHLSSESPIVLTADACDAQDCEMTIYLGTTLEEGVWVPGRGTRNAIQHGYGRLIVYREGSWSELLRVSNVPDQRTIWQFVLPGDSVPIIAGSFTDPGRAWSEACITIPIGIGDVYVLADAHWRSS